MTEPKTVTVRIAVAVWPDGRWIASGYSDAAVKVGSSGCARYWVTATLPLPQKTEIAGTVEVADDA